MVNGSLEALPHLKRRGGALINVWSSASGMPAPPHEDASVSVTHSPYTWAQKHPGATAALLVGGVAVAGALFAARGGDGRSRRPSLPRMAQAAR